MNECMRCGSPTRMQVQAVISAPGELAHQLSKKNLRSKDVYLMGVLWETADFICTNPKCGTVRDGYGNYVTNLKKEVEQLRSEVTRLTRAWESMQRAKQKAIESERELFSALQEQRKQNKEPQ